MCIFSNGKYKQWSILVQGTDWKNAWALQNEKEIKKNLHIYERQHEKEGTNRNNEWINEVEREYYVEYE